MKSGPTSTAVGALKDPAGGAGIEGRGSSRVDGQSGDRSPCWSVADLRINASMNECCCQQSHNAQDRNHRSGSVDGKEMGAHSDVATEDSKIRWQQEDCFRLCGSECTR